ncbi:MAG TPA: DUF4202 family protein [Thermoanaerobaculia bacterium]|nr:DUF4202 family protein [Thermoanaerobaculia bacterium]
MSRYYPVFLDLRERLAVVVGGCGVAEEKVRGLLAAGARVRVVADSLGPGLEGLAAAGEVEHRRGELAESDLDGAVLVLAERLGTARDRRVFEAAEARRIFVNVQDDVSHCSFIAPSIVRRGDLQVAISTSGSAPALAVRLRERLEAELGPEYEELLELARRSRRPLAAAVPDFEERRRRWYRLVDSEVLGLLRGGERARAEQLAAELLGVVAEPAGAAAGSSGAARFERACAEFDRLEGERPEALLYARRVSAWVERLAPAASEALRLAARCQHLRRWERPRSAYPQGRRGYLAWRRAAQQHHAGLARRVLAEAGYQPATVARVADLVQKKRLRSDPETQTLEDAACLVFLEHGMRDFAAARARDKVIDVLGKTWNKMSEQGRRAAFELELPADLEALVADTVAAITPQTRSSAATTG